MTSPRPNVPQPAPRQVSAYRGARAGVATKHDKTPVLAQALSPPHGGLYLRAVDVDTDVLGTFTGDVPRSAPPRETAVAKARLAISEPTTGSGWPPKAASGPTRLLAS